MSARARCQRFLPYAVAVGAVGAAALLRWCLDPVLMERVPFLLFYLSVMVAAWYGGTGPGLLALALSWLAADYLFVEPRFTLHAPGADLVSLLLYLPVGGALIALVESHRRAGLRTEQVLAELRANEERWSLAVRATNDGIWDYDVRTGKVFWSDRWLEMLGYGRGDVPGTIDAYTSMLHPDDRERVWRCARDHMEGRSPYFECEFRIRQKDGAWRWVHSRGMCERDAAGTPTRFIGSHRDVQHRVEAEAALHESEERLRLALAAGQMGAWDWDVASGRLRWDPVMYGLVGLDPAGRQPDVDRFLAAIHPDDRTRAVDAIERAKRAHEDYRHDYRFVRPDGTVRWFSARGRFFYDERGAATRMIGVVVDVTDLQQARQEAESASAAKDRMLAVLSHELRTPLTPVLFAADVMARRGDVPADLRPHFEMISRNVRLEVRLIDDLLDLTRIGRGKISLDLRPVDLHDLLGHVLEMCRAEAADKGLALSARAEAPAACVQGDPARLQQIIWNLVRNAIKFTPAGGAITISTAGSVAPDDPHVRLAVADTGVGIDPDVLPRIFDAFEQGGADTTRRYGGLGLGLAISRGLADLHGGTLLAHSDGAGRGATFVLRLPLATPADLAAARAAPAPPVTEDVAAGPAVPGATPAPAPPAGPVACLPAAILLVEDHPDSAAALARILEMAGHRVTVAGSVADALGAARGRHFDLLLSDLGLPDGTGSELLQGLLAQGHGKPPPAIALSCQGMEAEIRNSLAAGFCEHLVKPVDIDRLEHAIRRALASAAAAAAADAAAAVSAATARARSGDTLATGA